MMITIHWSLEERIKKSFVFHFFMTHKSLSETLGTLPPLSCESERQKCPTCDEIYGSYNPYDGSCVCDTCVDFDGPPPHGVSECPECMRRMPLASAELPGRRALCVACNALYKHFSEGECNECYTDTTDTWCIVCDRATKLLDSLPGMRVHMRGTKHAYVLFKRHPVGACVHSVKSPYGGRCGQARLVCSIHPRK